MKKFIILILISFIFFGLANFAFAQEDNQVDIYFFYGSTCPHCKKAEVFLKDLQERYPSIKMNAYEVYSNKDNAKLLLEFLKSCEEEEVVMVPAIFIGDKAIIGYLNDEITGKTIEKAVENCLIEVCVNPLEKLNCEKKEKKDEIINYPFIGQINLSKLSLPILTVVVGALDGFNPCAMWVLLFLIALLVNVKSRKKMWLVGGTFILASGAVYFLLLTAWLNLFLAISYVGLTRIIIGIIALGAGIWQIRNFIVYKPGVCEVAPVNSKRQEKLTEKAKQIVQSSALPATLLGIIALALGVNLIEFFCSAGLPAIYTRILSLNELSSFSYYSYLLLYTFIFILDDLIIFGIALITLSQIGFTEKYTKWSTLIGGLLIFLLGLLLIFRPEILMFG
ncbi:hypothetical protein KKH35_02835 [Patescibacteria group bacterium]|nr:hypothetical protein [Patescibacteria group bacterium]